MPRTRLEGLASTTDLQLAHSVPAALLATSTFGIDSIVGCAQEQRRTMGVCEHKASSETGMNNGHALKMFFLALPPFEDVGG